MDATTRRNRLARALTEGRFTKLSVARVSDSLVRRYKAGTRRIPDGFEFRLAGAFRVHAARLEALARQLEI